MGITLGRNQYGKAENRVVRVYRDTARHELRDLNVSTSLRGDFTDAHMTGDQAAVLPTDTQKNTVYAYAKKVGISSPEAFGIALGERYLAACPAADAARVELEEYAWERLQVDGQPHDHSFVRRGPEYRTAVVTTDDSGGERKVSVIAGISELIVLKSTGSGFKGFLKDEYTTLAETTDRIMATSMTTRWRYNTTDVDWDAAFADIKAIMLTAFAREYSQALQQTLYQMGEAVLKARSEVDEVLFSAPNKHHFLVDLSPFGLENDNEVFYAADRPYGRIEATVTRDDVSDPGTAWLATPGFC
jgi:urate oxidase